MSPRRVVPAMCVGLFAALSSCRGDPVGKPCAEDDDCGPGFDCYLSACVQVCTRDDECRRSETCYRYHCIPPGHESGRGPNRATGSPSTQPAVTSSRPPPPPDTVAAELRALRRELELMRNEQARLADLMQQMQTGKMPKGTTPTKPAPLPVVPPAP